MDAIGVGVNIVDSIVQNADSVLEGSLEILPRSARDAGPELQSLGDPLQHKPIGFKTATLSVMAAMGPGGLTKPPGEMPIEHMSAITPTEVLRWPYPRAEEANRWEKKPESKQLDHLVHNSYTTPVGHWNFFHSRSTTNSAPPHAPPCGREAPQGRTDRREFVVARSVEEGIRVLKTHYCKELDFTNNVVMSHKDVAALQAPFREDDVKADYGKTATTKALVVRRAPPNEPRDRDQEHEDAQAINRLREVQAPAVKLLKLIAKQPTLHTLRIDCKNLGEEAFCCLAASLEENTSLRILDCSSNHLTPHAAGLLGFSLRNHPLEELYLDFCTVGLNGAYHFANSIYGNSALRVLSLRGNNIGPDFPKSLLWLITPLPVSQGGGSYTKKTRTGHRKQFQCGLRTLRLDDNPLKDLPIRLGSINHSIDVSMLRCALEHPAPEIVAQGWKAIWTELKAEFEEYEEWHAEQVRQHNSALAHNPVNPPWQRAADYEGLTADDL